MSSSDSLYPFSSLIDLMDIQGGAQPPAKTFKNNPEEGYVRFVQIRDFETDAHLTYIQALPKWRYCTERDVLIARYGASVGRICRGVSGAYNVALAKVVPKDADLDFLYHLLRTRFFQDPLAAMSGRSAQAGFNKEDLAAIKVPHPSIDDQKKIVAALNCLDERIDLLREINATLEAIAQALFKSWFVDFDPVRAKMEGRAPEGMDEATAALFPDSFEESELGLVPKGWRVGKLEELLVLQRGFDLPAADRVEGAYPIIAASGPAGTHNVAMAKPPGVITGRSGVLGRVFLALEDYWPLNTTLWVKEFRAASSCYAYELLKRLDFASFNAGSAVPTLNRNHVHSLPYLIPPRGCVDAYELVANALHSKVRASQEQAQILRDTLLPRLISGQLRLSDD